MKIRSWTLLCDCVRLSDLGRWIRIKSVEPMEDEIEVISKSDLEPLVEKIRYSNSMSGFKVSVWEFIKAWDSIGKEEKCTNTK